MSTERSFAVVARAVNQMMIEFFAVTGALFWLAAIIGTILWFVLPKHDGVHP